jgi:hypothetical protein
MMLRLSQRRRGSRTTLFSVSFVICCLALQEVSGFVGVAPRAHGGRIAPVLEENKRAKKVDREVLWAAKKAGEEQEKKRRMGRATNMLPAAIEIAGAVTR